MKKYIFLYFILFTSHICLGMEQAPGMPKHVELVFSDPNIMSHITQQFCTDHEWSPQTIKNEIKNLVLASKLFCTYFSDENNAQNIVRGVAQHYNMSDEIAARNLDCKKILTTINYFREIAEKPDQSFTPEDMQKPWYFHSTTTFFKQSLLYHSVCSKDLEKIKFFIDQGIKFTYGKDQSLLRYIVEYRWLNRYNKRIVNKLFAIAQLLLEKNILPDGRAKVIDRTPLMCAIINTDIKIARLLLKHGANPHLLFFNADKCSSDEALIAFFKEHPIDTTVPQYSPTTPWLQNAFALEQGEPWLQAMVDEIALEKALKIKN